jgi:hypothetical protein
MIYGYVEQSMTPTDIITSGLQILSNWLLYILALLSLTVAAIVCLIVVEVVFERGAIARAYTVKPDAFDPDSSASGSSAEN